MQSTKSCEETSVNCGGARLKLSNRVSAAAVSTVMAGALVAGIAPVAQAANAESTRSSSSVSTAHPEAANQAFEKARLRVLATSQPQTVKVGEGAVIEFALPETAKGDGVISPQAHWNWGWVTGTLYLNKAETHKAALGTAGVAAIINSLPIPDWAKTAVLGVAGVVVYQAGVASKEDRCIKIKVPTASVRRYSGEHCD
ncbi:hypothetical protein [Streptomyces apocyni]|uniref:hypothetical protein n=1 Tax=Streptomyces apocyni TaxID=2654677 RepID=UPI0012EA7FD8|nr:hypothetical protein [Streptomyces apocyni]